MKASILINNYNYGKYLRQCIDSACMQTYEDVEVVIVDDHSTDNSIDIINSYGERVTPVLKDHGGQASCFNVGFSRSAGEVIFFLDADDEFCREKVQIMMNVYASYDVEWCFDVSDTSGMPKSPISLSDESIIRCDFSSSMAKGIFPYTPAATSGLSFRRSLLSKILPMPTSDGITLSDNYLKFAGAALGKGAICTVPLTHQRIHGANRYTGSTQMKRRQAEIMMETGRQLVVHFPHLSNIGVSLVSNAIAVRIAQGADQFPLLFRHDRGGPFSLTDRARITALSALKAARLLLSEFRSARTVG